MPLEPEKYLGRIAEVRFLDHVSSSSETQELLLCVVWGKIVYEDWQSIRVQTWITDDNDNNNAEFVVLVRAAVVSIRPLKYDEER